MKRLTLLTLVGTVAALVALQTAAAGGTTRYVSPSGADNATCSKNAPCKHVQQAVNVANAGDTISLAAGTYTEQVTIAKSLSLSGAGASSSTIASPAALAPDGGGAKNIVEVNGGASVQMSKLAVAGPGPAGCDGIDNGIYLTGGASLAITQSTVRDIHDTPLDGCQNGNAVAADSGSHLDVDHSTISNYQKDGIVVSGAGSTGQIDHNTVQTLPTDQIASNGVEIDGGATGTIDHNSISGNECNVAGTCGPDWFSQFQASGVLALGTGVTVTHNDLSTNDIGIYTPSDATIDHNTVASRDFGILTDTGNSADVDHNSVTGGVYGIYEFGGTGTFSHNSGSGASAFDLSWDSTGSPSFDHNQCGTASPSKAAWDCH
ncbi:MAG TPA: right-handed parallel beta-helix repeat-containing protein [Gaiellaceae bacterium]|nr:right-handed parallel beta-helix repeat-containing protein [Gaiellaceae bacterium]